MIDEDMLDALPSFIGLKILLKYDERSIKGKIINIHENSIEFSTKGKTIYIDFNCIKDIIPGDASND